MDLFIKLTQESCESITPSSFNKLPTWILVVVEVNLGNECKLLYLKKYDLDMYDLLMPVSTNISHSVPFNNFPLV